MLEKQYLGINTNFDDLQIKNYTEIDFRTSLSILDYDAVIIETSWIPHTYSTEDSKYQGLPVLSKDDSMRIAIDFKRLKTEIIEFLNSDLLLTCTENCYIYRRYEI